MTPRCPANGKENRQLFSIYVIELADGSLYVGSTANLAERLRAHREDGGRGARGGGHYVSGKGSRYRRDLSPQQKCTTRARIEALEAKTARRLRAKGYRVRQG